MSAISTTYGLVTEMGSKVAQVGVESVYNATEARVDRGLRSDDSLFTPGTAVWS